MEVTRLFDLLQYQQERYPQEDAFANKIHGAWVKHSTQEIIDKANKVSIGLLKLGIGKDDKIAIISHNRPEWNIVDFGIQQLGAVSVPIYPTVTEDDFRFIFKDAEVKIVFVETEELYRKAKNAAAGLDHIKEIYTFCDIAGAKNWKEVKALATGEKPAQLDVYKEKVKSEDVVTIIYTSGTTGTPKGVMLMHSNIISNFSACLSLMPVNHNHKALSFLPMCHVYERMLVYLYMSVGVSIYYAESMDTIADNLKEVKPDIFTTVPRLLEKVYDKIVSKGRELTGVKKALFFWALDLGLKFDMAGKMDGGTTYNWR